jgi:hypothetical protein
MLTLVPQRVGLKLLKAMNCTVEVLNLLALLVQKYEY